MRSRFRELTRLADLPPENDPTKVALLIQSARQAPDEALPLVKWRIQNTLRRRTEWSHRGVRLVFVGALIFLVGGVVGALAGPLLGSRRRLLPPEPAGGSPPARAIRHTHRRAPGQSIPSPPADQPLVSAAPSALPVPAAPTEAQPVVATDAFAKPKGVIASVAATATASKTMALRPSTAVQARQAPRSEPASLSPPAAPPSLELSAAKTPIPAESSGEPAGFGAAPSREGMARPSEASGEAGQVGGRRAERTLPGFPYQRLAMRDSPIVPAGAQNVAPEKRPTLPNQPASLANSLLRLPSPTSNLPPPPDEHALLKTALYRLRTAHEPVSALAALDDYRVRFPSGGLAPEVAMLRAEALLQIGRKGEALAELDQMSLGQMPNSDERYVVRGELRAAVGRWREALGDFDVVLRGHTGEEAEIGVVTDMKLLDRFERALWGRALVRSRLGDDAGARADLQACLRRFPHGRFASEAARLLGAHR